MKNYFISDGGNEQNIEQILINRFKAENVKSTGKHSDSDGIYRFTPDFCITNELYIDAKQCNSKHNLPTIYKDAYESYLSESKPTYILIHHNNEYLICNVKDVRFVDPTEILSEYPEDRRYPYVDGWIQPRLKTGFQRTKRMSGTPYNYIDIEHSNFTVFDEWTVDNNTNNFENIKEEKLDSLQNRDYVETIEFLLMEVN